MATIKFIAIHHTAVSRENNPDQWKATNDFHKTRFGMLSKLGWWCGYNYEISANGTVRQARLEGEETTAAIGHNLDTVHICLDGNFDVEFPTKVQEESLVKLLTEVSERHNIPYQNIVGHRVWCGNPPYKSCPGYLLDDEWGQKLFLYAKLNVIQKLYALLKKRIFG